MPADAKTPGQRVIQAAEEALRFARGEDTGARVTVYDAADVQVIRKKLGFTQQEFASHFGVSLGTLRNWEQGARIPEGPAQVLLTVIDRIPEAVKRALTMTHIADKKQSVARKSRSVRKPGNGRSERLPNRKQA